MIIQIAQASQENNLEEIERNPLGDSYKWKIAFHYQNPNKVAIVNIFNKVMLQEIIKKEFNQNFTSISNSYKIILNNTQYQLEEVLNKSESLWKKYSTKTIKKDSNTLKISENKIPLNQILYGPPGTGKTYSVINKALEILGIDCEKLERDEINEKYNEFRKKGQIEFITFHQSYSYEEFVEGIKPDIDENGSAFYEIRNGIFKEICNLANQETREVIGKQREQVKISSHIINKDKDIYHLYTLPSGKKCNDYFNECVENGYIKASKGYGAEAIKDKVKEGDYITIPSSVNGEKSRSIRAFGVMRGNVREEKENKGEKGIVNWIYRDVDWIWVAENENNIIRLEKNELNFGRTTFSKVSDERYKDSILNRLEKILNPNYTPSDNKKPYILIIDEINRGNISKILGELITLIEPSKRLGEKEAIEVKLPYSGESFGVPNNLYIIGTMNTADRSIALMDTALRRRFSFVEMMPNYKELEKIQVNNADIQLNKLLEAINTRIEYLLDRERTIGHAFFFENAKKDEISQDKERYITTLDNLKIIFKNKIIPLLQEYFCDDYEKIKSVLNDDENKFIEVVKSEENPYIKTMKDFIDDDKILYKIADSKDWEIENFTKIYDDKVNLQNQVDNEES